MEMQEILDTSSATLRRQQDRQAEHLESNQRLRAALVTAAAAVAPQFATASPPPSYVTPLATERTTTPNAPEDVSGRASGSESR